jgi:tRNA dimethylallyltransferase
VDSLAIPEAPLIVITGPTGGGKSAAGLELAQRVGGEIVSCDSLQVFKGFDIGSAKPTTSEQARVRHHLIDIVEPDQEFSAASWARLAREAIELSSSRGRHPIVVGGTGLYLKALLHGLFDGPSRDEGLRARLADLAERRGDAHLHAMLSRLDPAAARRIGACDRVRMVRALEVRLLTGRRISERQTQWGEARSPIARRTVLLGLDPGREALRRAIERRVDIMLSAGLVEEVRGLVARWGGGVRPLQSIGYRQVVAFLAGVLTHECARSETVSRTTQFAKRQRTWFRHQTPPEEWFDTGAALIERAASLLGASGGVRAKPLTSQQKEIK